MVESGEGTQILGGKMIGLKASEAKGEYTGHGPRRRQAKSTSSSAGDIVHIPAKISTPFLRCRKASTHHLCAAEISRPGLAEPGASPGRCCMLRGTTSLEIRHLVLNPGDQEETPLNLLAHPVIQLEIETHSAARGSAYVPAPHRATSFSSSSRVRGRADAAHPGRLTFCG